MQKVKFDVNQKNRLQQGIVNQNETEFSDSLETQDAVDTDESTTVDDAGNEGVDEYKILHNTNGSVATTVSQKGETGDDFNDFNSLSVKSVSDRSNGSNGSDDSNDSNDSDGFSVGNESIESIGDDGIDRIEFPALTDKPVQVPDAAIRYGISRQAFYKRVNYLGFTSQTIGGKSYFSREQMETFDRLALWIRENGTMNGFLGETALVVSQGSSVHKASTKSNSVKSASVASGSGFRQRQRSDAQIVAERAQRRAAQMLIGEDVAVNYLLENPDKISDDVMDDVLNFREGMQASMVDSSVGKPFDPEVFANDILNCFAQAG